MSIQKVEKIRLGSGDLLTGVSSEFSSGSAVPNNANGADGDVYVRVAGGNSNVYQRRSGVWVSLIGAPLTVTLPDNTPNSVVFAIPATAARFLSVNYSVSRSTNYEKGELQGVNDTASAALSQYGIATVGAGSVGVTLDLAINGANVELRASTDSQGVSAQFTYTFTNWA